MFFLIIDQITTASIQYLRGQIDAGAEAVQLFDSWAEVSLQINLKGYQSNMAITKALKDSHPDIPVIGFPK